MKALTCDDFDNPVAYLGYQLQAGGPGLDTTALAILCRQEVKLSIQGMINICRERSPALRRIFIEYSRNNNNRQPNITNCYNAGVASCDLYHDMSKIIEIGNQFAHPDAQMNILYTYEDEVRTLRLGESGLQKWPIQLCPHRRLWYGLCVCKLYARDAVEVITRGRRFFWGNLDDAALQEAIGSQAFQALAGADATDENRLHPSLLSEEGWI